MASEEDEKELELKDLIIQTLEANGVLPKLKAQIRASVFSALEETDKATENVNYLDSNRKSYNKNLLSTREGRITISLVREFLQACNLDYSIAVFEPEINSSTGLDERSKLAKSFDLYENEETKSNPILFEIVKSALSNQIPKTRKIENLDYIPKELPVNALNEAKKRFDHYDKNKNGIIDKNELRDLFVDLHPFFNKNMLERYVNDEFNAADRNLSSGIDFNEFKAIYKRWFMLCRSVVANDAGDLLNDRSEKSESQDSSKSGKKLTNNKLIDNNRLTSSTKPANKNDLIDLDDTSSSSSTSSITEKIRKANNEKKSITNTQTTKVISNNLLDDDDFFSKKPNGNHVDNSKSNTNSSTSTINNKNDAKTSLKDAPNLFSKPSSNAANLKGIDKIKGLGIGDYEDENYDDDFTSGTTPRTSHSADKRRVKTRNFGGSDEEIDENISYAEESSKFDEVTVDKSISTLHGNNDADYIEDLSN